MMRLYPRFRLCAFFGFLLLPACTSVENAQDWCLRSQHAFKAQADCIGERISQDDYLSACSQRRYFQIAEALKAQVSLNRLSEDAARARLMSALQRIEDEDFARKARQSGVLDESFSGFPGMNDCVREPASPQCLGIR